MFENLSLLQLTAVAEEFVWGQLPLDDIQREELRSKLIERFAQVEELNRFFYCPPKTRRPDVNS